MANILRLVHALADNGEILSPSPPPLLLSTGNRVTYAIVLLTASSSADLTLGSPGRVNAGGDSGYRSVFV